MPPPQVLAIISQKKKPNVANEKRPTLLAHELTEKPYFKIYHKIKLPTNLIGQSIVLVGY